VCASYVSCALVFRVVVARNLKPADIYRQLCKVYGEHTMCDSMVRRWARHFHEGRENMHDDPRSGRPSVVKIWCVQWKRKFKKTDDSPFFTFPAFSTNFTVTSSRNCV
jgi:transposase